MTEEIQGQGEDLVVVFRASDEYIADIVKGLLEGESIPVILESRQVPWMDGVMKMGEGYWGDVVVPREHAARARELIDAYQSGEDASDAEETEPTA
ncbi:MAG: putative signal transducing protein [Armatimonadota bacterium]